MNESPSKQASGYLLRKELRPKLCALHPRSKLRGLTASDKPHVTEEILNDSLKKTHHYTEQVKLAIELAKEIHKNQKRDDGRSYLEQHIFPISLSVADKYKSADFAEEIIITALLHDVLEDSQNSMIERIRLDFGDNIVNNLQCITKRKTDKLNRTQHDRYIENKKIIEDLKKSSVVPQIVKLEDRLNNLQSTEKLPDKKVKYRRYIEATRELYIPFAQRFAKEYVSLFEKEVERITKDVI